MKFINKYCWVFVSLFILFIFMNSSVPAVASKQLSGSITTMLHQFLNNSQIQVDIELLHYLIRKSAHFLEYSLLGSLIFTAIYFKPFIQSKLLNFACFLFVPVLDELIQWFVPGRSCEFGDVCLDISGMIFGYFLLTLLLYLFRKRSQ